MLKRKIDLFLIEWKRNPSHKPLIVYGPRQIGKTTSIEQFGKNYRSFIEIDFIKNPEYKSAFESHNPEQIVKRLSIINPKFVFIPNETLIFIDEIQEYIDATTCFKYFCQEGKYDLIASGSALGVNNSPISSVSVGFKEEYIMHHMDFEEFLWANGYDNNLIDELLNNMVNLKPLEDYLYKLLDSLYMDYILLGGFPEIINKYFINNKNYSGIFDLQKRIYKDYEDDLSKYLSGLDITKAQRVYNSVASQLAKDNHKFQFTKLGHGARFNSYYGVVEWLKNSGVILLANNVALSLPLKGNEIIDNFRMYYSDISLLIATLDEESSKDLRINNNIGVYKGAIYENICASALAKQGCSLYFYRSEDSTIEFDFIIRYKDSIIPIEVKAKNGRTRSLITGIESNPLISKAIKFAKANIGTNKNIITFPHFLSFLFKRYLEKIR